MWVLHMHDAEHSLHDTRCGMAIVLISLLLLVSAAKTVTLQEPIHSRMYLSLTYVQT